MAFIFPNTPTIGQTVVNPNNNSTYTWDGFAWSSDLQSVNSITSASYIAPLTGSFEARKSSQTFGTGQQLILITWDSGITNTIPNFTYAGGVFTNTALTKRKFLFQYQCWVGNTSNGTYESSIFFTKNGVDNFSNRYGFHCMTNYEDVDNNIYGGYIATQPFVGVQSTSYMFILNPGDTIRCYVYSNSPNTPTLGGGLDTYAASAWAPSFPSNYSTRISVIEFR